MKPRVRKPGTERRTEIAEAVLRIIGERGLTTLSTSTIAAEVGLTTGALYRHFASIDEILEATTRHGVARIDATFPDPGLPPLERILTLVRQRVDLLGQDPGLAWLLRSEQAHLNLPEEAANRLRNVVQRSRRLVLAALREGATAGAIRNDIPPEVLLTVVLGTTHAVIGTQCARKRMPSGSTPGPEQVIAALRRILEYRS
jgi:AcrR family transcriptional regulator